MFFGLNASFLVKVICSLILSLILFLNCSNWLITKVIVSNPKFINAEPNCNSLRSNNFTPKEKKLIKETLLSKGFKCKSIDDYEIEWDNDRSYSPSFSFILNK